MTRLVDLSNLPTNGIPPTNGMDSVSRDLVSFGRTDDNPNTIATVRCHQHGAMNCMAITPAGKIWRCTTCNVGALQVGD